MVIDWSAVPSCRSPREGDTRRIASGEHISMVRIEIRPDAEFTGVAHSHPHEQWAVVLAGQVQMVVGGQVSWLEPGGVLYIPVHTDHAPLAVGPLGATYLEIFSPPRLDLLPGSLVPPV